MSCTGLYTIGRFLKDVSPLVTEEGIHWVCAKRGITCDAPFMELDERERDLAEGTMYYWLSNLPVGGSTEKVSDGGFSHSKGGWTVSKANIEAWLQKYRQLFGKWDEGLIGNSRIRILNW
jgi:hypothetical protein